MRRFEGKTVLITGASSGIGAALATEFATQGAALVLAARRVELLEQLASPLRAQGTVVRSYYCDVTEDQSLQAMMTDLLSHHISVDIVIANAGFGVVGRFERLSLLDYQRQFDTNVFGVIRTAYATLPLLRSCRGSLVIIGSIAGHVAQPGASAYSMSKFAVRALAESLRMELADDDVSVTLISPGIVESNLRRVDNLGAFHPQAREPFPAWLRMSASQAARQIVNAVHRRQREQVITLHGKVAVWLSRFAPGLLRFAFSVGLRARQQPNHSAKK